MEGFSVFFKKEFMGGSAISNPFCVLSLKEVDLLINLRKRLEGS